MKPKLRLYVELPLGPGQDVELSRAQAHYVFGVMRQGDGAQVALFNGRDGEWLADVVETGKRSGRLVCAQLSAPHALPPDLWLLFAPVKKTQTDFIVEKAVELGVRRLLPVQTDYTNSERVKTDRLLAHAVEAAEQCGAVYVPQIMPYQRLSAVLQHWDTGRQLVFCDEARHALPLSRAVLHSPGAVLIGPEGGFSAAEAHQLRAQTFVKTVTLGPRILRAETAAVAALTLWQTLCGDWT